MAGNPNPSPSTRFTSENNPRQGRKKGAVANKTVQAKVDLKLKDMLGKSFDNVRLAINKKDLKTSMWLIDKLMPDEGTRLEADLLGPLVDALENLEDVEQISKSAVLLAIKGDMSFEQLKYVQEALARHSVLAGVIELSKLREEVEAMTRDSQPSTAIGRGHMPEWGKLKDVTPTHEESDSARPAE